MDEVAEQEIRHIVGRPLTELELATYASLDLIPDAVVAIVSTIARHGPVLAVEYLEERVPNARSVSVKLKVEQIMKR